MNEFEMIQTYFLPLTMGREEAVGLQDDAAILNVPDGYDLVMSSDTLNGGTHFLKDENPTNIAHKVLRVNLSDMVAMGAQPLCYQMNLAFSQFPDEEWVKEFTTALLADNEEFGVFCSGGDTTVAEGPLLVSLTVTGLVPKGKAVKRSGAKAGDLAVVTGTIGDPAIGVKLLLKSLELDNPEPFLEACHKPVPRIPLAKAIHEYAHAAVDISDGLMADLGHVCQTSGVAARLEQDALPFSDEAQAVLQSGKIEVQDLLTGGDDYEIGMAVPPENLADLQKAAQQVGIPITVIGKFEEGQGIQVLDRDNTPLEFTRSGWTHF